MFDSPLSVLECREGTNMDESGDLEYNKVFWDLWPKPIHEDLDKLNKVIEQANRERKERYQRVLRSVSSYCYLFLILLLSFCLIHNISSNTFRIHRSPCSYDWYFCTLLSRSSFVELCAEKKKRRLSQAISLMDG